ncbi:hypothetical protein [Cupriavidus necator]
MIGWFILGSSSILSFVASIYGSAALTKAQFGTFTAYSAFVSILALCFSFGTGGYYLSHLNDYKKNQLVISFLPMLLGSLGAVFFVATAPSIVNISFSLLFFVSLASVQGILKSQVDGTSGLSAAYQAMPALVKAISLLCLPFGMLIFKQSPSFDSFTFLMSCLLLICLAALLLSVVRLRTGVDWQTSSLKRFIAEFDSATARSLGVFWASSMLALSYNMGLPPLVATRFGPEIASYLGIYMIFWGATNIAIVAVINNHLMIEASRAYSKMILPAVLVKKAVGSAMVIGLLSMLGTISAAWFGEKFLWKGYPDIFAFLVFCSVALFCRAMSAGMGIFISFRNGIKVKTLVQLLVLLFMVGLLCSVESMNPRKMGKIVLALEGLLVFSYSISGFLFVRKAMRSA